MKSLLPKSDSPLWKESARKGGTGVIRWIPITASLSEGLEIGIDSDGRWVHDTAEGIARVGDGGRYVALLPLLQSGRLVVLDAIRGALENKGMSVDIASSFPFPEIIIEGLRTRGYWGGLAVAALEQEALLTPAYESPLSELRADKTQTTQQIRHAAERLLHKLRKDEQE